MSEKITGSMSEVTHGRAMLPATPEALGQRDEISAALCERYQISAPCAARWRAQAPEAIAMLAARLQEGPR